MKTGAQTISHAICLSIVLFHTCDEWILSKSRVLLRYPTRFHESHEKRNLYDWRTQIRHRWCARLADTIFRARGKRRAVLIIADLYWRRLKGDLDSSEIRLPSKSLDHHRDVPPAISDKFWGSLLFHRPVVESSSFLRLPFREQALGTGGVGWIDSKLDWCPSVKWGLGKHELLIDLSPS